MDSIFLPTLNQLGTQQALPTQNTLKALHQLLDYVHTYQNAYLQFNASGMILHIDIDAAYLYLPKTCSRISGYFRLSDQFTSSSLHDRGDILIECKGLH